jgi:hypothetical protein
MLMALFYSAFSPHFQMCRVVAHLVDLPPAMLTQDISPMTIAGLPPLGAVGTLSQAANWRSRHSTQSA